jgi:lysophospholipase L1-like esterase
MGKSNHAFHTAITLCLLTTPLFAQDQDKSFYLQDNDRVVFYGDSITEQHLYTADLELYLHTRFPQMHVAFFNAGVGGDTVQGGSGGTIDERLQRDVIAKKPTVVTIMLGMNDAGPKPLTPDADTRYTEGYEHILQTLHTALPEARITLLGPAPFDEVTRPNAFPGGRNAGLVHFSALCKELAAKHHATYIDLNAPVVSALQHAKTINPFAARLLIPDRVHPTAPIHWVMAQAILEAWNAPSLITATRLDADHLHYDDSEWVVIQDLRKENGTLLWRQTDAALPLSLTPQNSDTAYLLRFTDIEPKLDQQILKVTNLPPGLYRLTIDHDNLPPVTSQQLALGINLALLNTPMRRQAESLAWTIRDYEDTQFVHNRLLITDAQQNLSASTADPELSKFEDTLRDKIFADAQPKPHTFRLTPIPPRQN